MCEGVLVLVLIFESGLSFSKSVDEKQIRIKSRPEIKKLGKTKSVDL